MSNDVRFRSDAEPVEIDPIDLLDHELPALLAARTDLQPPARGHGYRPLVIEIDGERWTLRADPGDQSPAGTISLRRGEDVGTDRFAHVRLTAEQFHDLVADLVTPIGLMTGGVLDMPAGQIGHLLDWWVVLRSVLDDRPMFVPGSLSVPGAPARAFRLDDDLDDLRAFLAESGFLHLRGVFTEAEMAQISADMDAAASHFHRDDGRSWWARTSDGTDRLVRMQGFEHWSPTTAALLEDPRFLRIGQLGAAGHVHRRIGKNWVEALFKPLDVSEGISDVPWHKDCSLGRHSYECCSLTVGISITGAGPTTGQLRVIAGSHRALVWPSLLDPADLGLPEIALPTETGDVTVHLSCTLHMAQPPTTEERRVLYTDFSLPPQDPAATNAARLRLRAAARERAPLTTSQQGVRTP